MEKIVRMTEELLRELKSFEDVKLVYGMLRERQMQLSRAVAVHAQEAFRSGDRVEFNAKKRGGAVVRGVVTGILPKNIKVRADGGTVWTVFPTFLRKVEG